MESPDDVTKDEVSIELNTDFSTKGLSSQEIQSIVAAWEAGAISRETMLDLFRRGEVLPEAPPKGRVWAGLIPLGDARGVL